MTQHDKYADLSRLPIAEAEAFRAGMLKLLARLEAAEAVCEAASILLAGEGDVMTRMATTIDPAEYASTHEECHARDLEAALDVWKEASK